MQKLLKANGEIVEDFQPENGKYFTGDEIRAAIGGYMQAVNIRVDNVAHVLLVDEDALFKKVQIPNKEATNIIRQSGVSGMFANGTVIGNAVLMPFKTFQKAR